MKIKLTPNKVPAARYDIIIPVYNAYEEVKACIESVLRHTLSEQLLGNLVIIDDQSTDPRLRKYLLSLSASKIRQVNILRNRANLGYVHSVNTGMSLSKRDIVLLNSDTIVTSGWLKKMHKCASSTHQVATVTPLTNNGTICSVPEFYADNPIPNGLTIEEMAEKVERAAVPDYPELPTGVGFCMLIKQQVLDQIGLFDAATFGRGYGEENEFCCRASEGGFIHLLDDATFIYHKGSSSFREEKLALVARNSELLAEQFPDYFPKVQQFVDTNPLWEIQERIKRAIKQEV